MTNWTVSSENEPTADRALKSTRPSPVPNGVNHRTTTGELVLSPRAVPDPNEVKAEAPAERPDRQPVVIEGTLAGVPEAALDAVRYLVATLQSSSEDGTIPGRLGFTAALAGEGVTFVSQMTAAVIAHDYRERVCLIDLNWVDAGGDGKQTGRRRRAAGVPTDTAPGLAEALRREVSLREILLGTDNPRLSVVRAGRATEAEAQVFARSAELAHIIQVLARRHDHLILDLPPVLASSAAIPLTRLAEAVALVVRYGITTEAQVRSAIDRLSQVPSAGVVLNRSSSKIPRPLLRRLSSW
jgi:Mrp family chromosome partitioning ATPase